MVAIPFFVTSHMYVLINQAILAITISIAYARGVMVIIVGNGHGDTSSNPGRD